VIVVTIVVYLLGGEGQTSLITRDRMNRLLETVARHLSCGPSGLTELRYEEDFIKIDKECVDTPEFYGGGPNIPSEYKQ
jgi:hypothetical protein